jgi:hypothetical protein
MSPPGDRADGGKVIPAGLACWKGDEYATFPSLPGDRYPRPVTRCQLCDRTLAYRPGNISEVLTKNYRQAHPEARGILAG